MNKKNPRFYPGILFVTMRFVESYYYLEKLFSSRTFLRNSSTDFLSSGSGNGFSRAKIFSEIFAFVFSASVVGGVIGAFVASGCFPK